MAETKNELELIKIETDLDLAQAIIRILYYQSEGKGITTEEVVMHVTKKYDTDKEAVEKMLHILKRKYGLVAQWITENRIGWELIFGYDKSGLYRE